MTRSITTTLAAVISFASAAAAVGACGSFTSDGGSSGALAEAGPGDGAGPSPDADPGDGSPGADGAAHLDAGTTPVTDIATSLTLPWKIAVDSVHLYVTTHATPGQVVQLARDGSTSVPFATGLTSPTDITVGPQYVDWLAGDDIWRRPAAADQPATAYVSSSTPVALATRPGGAVVFAIAHADTITGGLAGASPMFNSVEYFTDLPGIASIAVVGDSAIYAGLLATSGPEGVRLYTFGSPISAPVPESADKFGAIRVIAADADRIVFAEASGDVHELKTASFGTAGASKMLSNGSPVAGIVLDEARRRSYWLTADGVVHRHDWMLGTVSSEAQGCPLPGGLAQDDARLYWTCPDQGKVQAVAK